MVTPHELTTRAVAAALVHVEAGGLPFVGIVMTRDGLVSEPGTNQVMASGDPTAHAEIVAMRALRALHPGRDVLAGSTLLASGEPCALCYRYAAEYDIGQVHYAVSADTAAAWGFDYRSPLTGRAQALAQRATRLDVTGALEPFRRYRQLHSRG